MSYLSVIDRPSTIFPSPHVPNEEKNRGWILKHCEAIYHRYRGHGLSTSRDQMKINRTYAKGKQDTSRYKKQLDCDDDSGYLNLSWTPVMVAPRLMDVVLGMLMDVGHKVNARSVDPMGQDARLGHMNKMKAAMDMSSRLGGSNIFQQMMSGVQIPETPEDLELYMDMDYKQVIEIGMEEGLGKIEEVNRYNEIKRKIIRNWLIDGIGGVKVYVDGAGMLRQRSINPIRFTHGPAESADKHESTYFGELLNYDLSDLRQLDKEGFLSRDDWEAVAKSCAGNNGNPEWDNAYSNSYNSNDDWEVDGFKIPVMDIEFKSFNYLTHEKKGNRFGNHTYHKRAYDFTPSEGGKYKREKVQSSYAVWYKAKWIVGSKFILDYGLCDHMPRGNKSEGKYHEAESSFCVYAPFVEDGDNEITSMMERMIPWLDGLCIAWLKFQNAIAESVPPGFAVDEEALSAAAASMHKDPMELIKLYKARGVVVYKPQVIEDTSMINQKPIIPMDNGLGPHFNEWMNAIEFNMRMLEKVTGIMEGIDGTSPDSRQLVGTTRIAANASIKSLRPIVMAMKSVYEGCSRVSAKKLQLLVKHYAKTGKGLHPHLKSLGSTNLGAMELAGSISAAEYMISILDLPSEEEYMALMEDITREIDAGRITTGDKMDVQRVGRINIKKASALLKLRIKKREEAMHQMEMQKIQETVQGQQDSASMAHQMRMQEIMAEAEASQQAIIVEAEAKKELMMLEYRLKGAIGIQEGNTKIETEVVKGEYSVKASQQRINKKENKN